jgi:hypothetical protein
MIKVITLDEKEYIAKIHALDPINDMCILKVATKLNRPKIILSKLAPTIGDKIYNVAAPRAFFTKNMVPLFDGYFLGYITINKKIVTSYSLLAYGGSSGSMILNKKMELISILHSGNRFIQQISFGTTYEVTKSFIDKNTVE